MKKKTLLPSSPVIAGSSRRVAQIEEPLMKDDLRLPRAAKLRLYAKGLSDVEKALRRFPKRMWDWSPKPGVHWCVREVLWHLADSEANYYIRIRRAAAEPGSPVSSWDHEKWEKVGAYKRRPALEAWALIRLLRVSNLGVLRRLPSKAWSQKVRHPDYGVLTLDHIIGMGVWHTRHHLNQMERRYREWKNR